MGQCTSNKAKGNLSVKKILSHKRPKKMDKHKQFKEPKDEDTRIHHSTTGGKDLSKKSSQKASKGVAMSFGFNRRPSTSMSSNTGSLAWDTGTTRPDANGNKDDPTEIVIERTMHKPTSSHQKPPSSITPRPSRFSFPPSTPDRTNKVADIRPLPLQFTTRPGSRRTSPSNEPDHALDSRTFTRNVTIITRTQIITEKAGEGKDGNENRALARDKVGGAPQTLQTGKFTFQTTRLPQPEPIRVIETKTAKTIANNNRRSARMWKQYEEESQKNRTSNHDSGFGSNASGGIEENERRCEEDPLRERLQSSKRFSLLETSNSFSDACTPPPLPELPSVFIASKHIDSNKDHERQLNNSPVVRDDYDTCKKAFLKSNPSSTFLKTRGHNLLDRDSPQSSSDQEWLNGGEAMADDLSLTPSPKQKRHENNKEKTSKKYTSSYLAPKAGAVAEAVLQTLLKPSLSLEMIDSLKDSMNLSLTDEDPNFTAVATNNNTAALLDDEMLSPVESLMSASETEEMLKKNIGRSSSNSKDVNEKLTPSIPGSPSNDATFSLSLSDDKDDFLIDDEIADQPELIFEDGHNAAVDLGTGGQLFMLDNTVEKDLSTSINQRRTSYNTDFSPLPSRKQRREFLSSANQGSFDSLSPCDSIGSEDLMMDFDVSQTNDHDAWDRQSGSFASLESSTPKPKFKIDETGFNNKNFFKSLTPKFSLTNENTAHLTNSTSALKSRVGHRSSSECRSPKRNHYNPFGFHSMTYDPTSEALSMTRANHSAAQQDIIGIKTMLLTLKRVLNESESHPTLKYASEDNNGENNNNNSEFRLELADLRRQVLFLHGQLEDKEKTVSNLQKQIDDLGTSNTQNNLDNTPLLSSDIENRCNAATQTDRTRPLSSGVFSVTSSPIDDNNPILRLMIK